MNVWLWMRMFFSGQPYAAEKALLMVSCVRHGGVKMTAANERKLVDLLSRIQGDPMKMGINVRRLILNWKKSLTP